LKSDAVDMDVNMTKDHVVVVTHHLTLNPLITRDQNGRWIDANEAVCIKDLTFEQLQQYDVGRINPNTYYAHQFSQQVAIDGTHISSLKQVIQYLKKYAQYPVRFQIEVKTDPSHPERTHTPEDLAKEIVNIIREEKIEDRTEIQAFDWRVLKNIQLAQTKIETAYLTDPRISNDMTSANPVIAGLWSDNQLLKQYKNSIPYMIAQLGGNIWGPNFQELTADRIQEAHKNGLKVITWTVNDPADMQLMRNFGVDGIITDYPNILAKILKRNVLNPKTLIHRVSTFLMR
ncbi:MAG: glycerophosphodiester phosphodiesterase, partial [Gammaproteobacteria bacterium]|nr:glycerophosphodiester phosphodiesterase [Gammaproteobacteria bacterium]